MSVCPSLSVSLFLIWWSLMVFVTLWKSYKHQFTVLNNNLCAQLDLATTVELSYKIIFKQKGYLMVPLGEENRPLLWRENIVWVPVRENINFYVHTCFWNIPILLWQTLPFLFLEAARFKPRTYQVPVPSLTCYQLSCPDWMSLSLKT